MADKRAYFKLDVGYLANPKVALLAAISPRAVLLHIASIGYAAQHLTDGIVPAALVVRSVGAGKRDMAHLVDAGLWIDMGDGQVAVHDYLEHQRSSAEVKGATDKARRAADARWSASGNASSMPDAMPREREEKERDQTSGLGAGKPPASRARQLPEDFRPSNAHQDLARELGVDLRAEWPQFVDHHHSKGSTMKDWDAALRTWIRNAKKFGRGPATTQATAPDWNARALPTPPPDIADDPERYAAWLADQRRAG